MKKFIITEDEKRQIKSLYVEQQKSDLNISSLSGGIKFVINNKSGFSSGEKLGGVTSELGKGLFIVFNQVPTVPGASLTLDFLNTTGANSAIVSMLTDKTGFMKDAKMFGLDDRGSMDFLSLICRGFYGNVTEDGILNILQSLRMLQQNQASLLGSSIISNFESIFKAILSFSSMTGPDFYAKYPTHLVSNKWGAGGSEMKAIYSASIKFFPNKNVKKV